MNAQIIVVTSREQLLDIIKTSAVDADLNHLDVSAVTDMSWLFENTRFNGDISKWDVSQVTKMYGMFTNSQFQGDISAWDISSVTDVSSKKDLLPTTKWTAILHSIVSIFCKQHKNPRLEEDTITLPEGAVIDTHTRRSSIRNRYSTNDQQRTTMNVSECNDLLLTAIAARLGEDPNTVETEFTGHKGGVSFLFTTKDDRRVKVTIDYTK